MVELSPGEVLGLRMGSLLLRDDDPGRPKDVAGVVSWFGA
ncbi:MAG: hypothetical protein QOI35_3209, partial [Cryptosporangiaceae bacterium]|nr:hypothetical protein [Cryptosporangiaceae bacterium]